MILELPAVTEHLETEVKAFTDIAVVGVSGGIDSSVVASICVRALGRENVHLVSMPYDEVDIASFNARSLELADKLGAPHHVVGVGAMTSVVESALEGVFGDDLHRLTRANVRPRVRMNVLYSLCGELGFQTGRRARVMGTGHLSEDLIGYDTKGGDALCDIFILSDLVKSEVYQLAAHYDVPGSIVEAVPSAGLYQGQTDEQELGHTYAALEESTLVLHGLLRNSTPLDQITASLPAFAGIDPVLADFVVTRYKLNFHKHEAPATVDSRRPGWFDPV
jgi:NAD+ synthase